MDTLLALLTSRNSATELLWPTAEHHRGHYPTEVRARIGASGRENRIHSASYRFSPFRIVEFSEYAGRHAGFRSRRKPRNRPAIGPHLFKLTLNSSSCQGRREARARVCRTSLAD